jgi:4-hydroxybenzoate polyprenyltransferase
LNLKVKGIIRLTRFQEFLGFVAVNTLLGAITAGGAFGWRFIIVLIANWLAVGFAFMINDVEDAEDDALNPAKIGRNPISSKHVTPRLGYAASFAVAGLSAIAYALLGWLPFLIGLVSLAVGFFYSWKPVRLKNMFLVDMLSHCMMLAGLQFLPAYFTFTKSIPGWAYFPFFFMVFISLYGELFNEMRDLEGDLKAGLKHTAAVLGAKATLGVMITVFSVGAISGIISLFFIDLIPLWVLGIMAALLVVLMVPRLYRVRKQPRSFALTQSLQDLVVNAAAIALGLQMLVPWAQRLILNAL